MKRKQKNKYKVFYTYYDKTADVEKYLKALSNLVKLNCLYEKNLLSKAEYEKVKCAIGFIADF